MRTTVACALLAATLAACSHCPRHVAAASDTTRAGMLGTVQKLSGEYEMQDEQGNWVPYGTYATCSGGSAVREVMFPGQGHEMTNMYTMDGNDLCVVHYCAVGNQPRMRCAGPVTNADGSTSLPFEFDSVTDLNAPEETYMGKMTLTVHPDGTASQEWWQLKQGKVTGEHHMMFKLRKKG